MIMVGGGRPQPWMDIIMFYVKWIVNRIKYLHRITFSYDENGVRCSASVSWTDHLNEAKLFLSEADAKEYIWSYRSKAPLWTEDAYTIEYIHPKNIR